MFYTQNTQRITLLIEGCMPVTPICNRKYYKESQYTTIRYIHEFLLWAFLVMLELKFSAQIVHHMLLHQCVTKKEDEMWFLVRSKGLRFGQDEFGLITGLSFGLIP